jgi:hypothetical protein
MMTFKLTSRAVALVVTLLVLAGTSPAQTPDAPARPGDTTPRATPAQTGATTATPPRAPGGAPPSKDALLMGSPPKLADGLTEQDMWPAATAEGWKKPVLIPWQRSFDDALRVAQATGKPILVAVNMDGEIASEHYAGVRYREPATAKLFDPYVCIVASVYRHTPRDHDEQGRRILCPRLGDVTCGEHIAAETELYAKYFDGVRISPRHLVLEPDGTETSDVYFSWDVQTVLTTLVKGAENRPPPIPLVHDMPIVDRTASPDVGDRTAIETEYERATPEVRRALLSAMIERRVVDQVEMLRLAIFGLDLEQARLARRALAQSETEGAVDLIAEALKVPISADERTLLLAASDRLSAKFPRARTLGAVHRGLAQTSRWIDPKVRPEAEYEARSRPTAPQALLEMRAADSESRPEDGDARLALAESLLAQAQDPATERHYTSLLLADARNAAQSARELGRAGWRLESVQAVTDALAGDEESARKHAIAAVEGGMLLPVADAEPVLGRTELRTLALFAQARQMAIRAAYRAGTGWPPEWLSDVNAAYALLAQHPLGSDDNLVSFYDFLRWLGGTPRANAVLDDAIARFPASALVHDRLRARVLWEAGPDELEAEYARRIAADPENADLDWFAGYASIVAAENHRRTNDVEKAVAAYGRAITRYEQYSAARPDNRGTADHFIALALAGRARVELGRQNLTLATDEVLASFAREPHAGATPDGLNITPVETAKMLRARLEEAHLGDALARLQAGLDALDPALLEKRAYELEDPRTQRGRGNGRGQTPR